ncbi:hypothetical protein [Saccharopolyspora taberi]|uniref:hypothetical protein n=1 Tax=Saccharopolyspora taberi TaxID=60895 RepID=UPI003CD0A1CB
MIPALIQQRACDAIPYSISFSITAGLDPSVGLFVSFTMAVVIAIVADAPR